MNDNIKRIAIGLGTVLIGVGTLVGLHIICKNFIIGIISEKLDIDKKHVKLLIKACATKNPDRINEVVRDIQKIYPNVDIDISEFTN